MIEPRSVRLDGIYGAVASSNEFGDIVRLTSPQGEVVMLTLAEVRELSAFAENEFNRYHEGLRQAVKLADPGYWAKVQENLDIILQPEDVVEDDGTWALLGSAEDGDFATIHPTKAAAMADLKDQLGWEPAEGRTRWIDDWGRAFAVEQRPALWTSYKERVLREAYDRRECGERLSKAQQAALDLFEGWGE